MPDSQEVYVFDYEAPPEGWGKYQVLDVRFELSKEEKKPMMVVESEYIEEGPESGTKLTTWNTYGTTFVLKRVKGLIAVCTGREPEDTPAMPLARSLDDEGFRAELGRLLIGKRFGAFLKHDTDKKGRTLPKPTKYAKVEAVDRLRSEATAPPPGQPVSSSLPTGLAQSL